MSKLSARLLVVGAAVALVVGGGYFAVTAFQRASRNEVVGYFQNTNQLFKGDDVLIQGVPSARSRRSNLGRKRSRSPSGSTTSTRCPPRPRP